MHTIQIRVDKKVKQSAKRILEDVGLDMSTAIKIYLKQIILQKGVPFPLVTENRFTIQNEKEIINAANEAKQNKHVTKPMSAKQALKHLNLL